MLKDYTVELIETPGEPEETHVRLYAHDKLLATIYPEIDPEADVTLEDIRSVATALHKAYLQAAYAPVKKRDPDTAIKNLDVPF